MTADERVVGLMGRAGVPAGRIAGSTPLTGGTYNDLHTVDLTDGTRLVLKVPPPPHLPRLRYEAELLHGEALFYESAAAAGVPAPRLVHAEPHERPGLPPYLLMTELPGVPWHSVIEDLAAAERDRLRTELGGLVARLHTVRGPGFGYPAQSVAPLAGRWTPAFTAMTEAVLDDARAYGPWLPLPLPEIRAVFAAAGPVLDEVAEPALVHFDLWSGNVLLDGPAGGRTISGLIDGERMFWGDPLADFAALSVLYGDSAGDGAGGDAVQLDPAFVAGYAAGGGLGAIGPAADRRIALYRAYLYLIMLVEVVPRRTTGEHLTWVREFIGPRLTAELDAGRG
jgi:aminoglycoside phosphotransferase (APT) family kinase protein